MVWSCLMALHSNYFYLFISILSKYLLPIPNYPIIFRKVIVLSWWHNKPRIPINTKFVCYWRNPPIIWDGTNLVATHSIYSTSKVPNKWERKREKNQTNMWRAYMWLSNLLYNMGRKPGGKYQYKFVCVKNKNCHFYLVLCVKKNRYEKSWMKTSNLACKLHINSFKNSTILLFCINRLLAWPITVQ